MYFTVGVLSNKKESVKCGVNLPIKEKWVGAVDGSPKNERIMKVTLKMY